MNEDISPDFRWNRTDAQTIQRILPHAETPDGIKMFERYASPHRERRFRELPSCQ